MGRPNKRPPKDSDAKKAYFMYAQNINVEHLQCSFGNPGIIFDVHGDNKSFASLQNITFHSMTMYTNDDKYKVWVYRGEGENHTQDEFVVSEPTSEEVLRVMLDRSKKFAEGKEVED